MTGLTQTDQPAFTSTVISSLHAHNTFKPTDPIFVELTGLMLLLFLMTLQETELTTLNVIAFTRLHRNTLVGLTDRLIAADLLVRNHKVNADGKGRKYVYEFSESLLRKVAKARRKQLQTTT